MPVRKPFTAILPKGPASKMAGGRLESGPVMDGVGRGAGGVAVWVADGFWAQTICVRRIERHRVFMCSSPKKALAATHFPGASRRPRGLAEIKRATCAEIAGRARDSASTHLLEALPEIRSLGPRCTAQLTGAPDPAIGRALWQHAPPARRRCPG